MTITMFDAVTASAIPANAKYACFYTDGRFQNGPAVRAQAPHATLMSITVLGGDADAVDCEVGDLNVQQGEQWIARRLAQGAHRPCIYADLNRWENEGLLKGLAAYGNKIRRWVAHFDGVAQVPAGYDAKQYSTDPNLDTSVCRDDFFTAPKPAQDKTTHGTAHGYVALDLKTGAWVVHGLPGHCHFAPPSRYASAEIQLDTSNGHWRLKPMPWNAPPLGG